MLTETRTRFFVLGALKLMASTEGIFEALLIIVVGLALLPVVRSFVDASEVNASGSEVLLLGLVTLFWILGVVAVAIMVARRSIKGK